MQHLLQFYFLLHTVILSIVLPVINSTKIFTYFIEMQNTLQILQSAKLYSVAKS